MCCWSCCGRSFATGSKQLIFFDECCELSVLGCLSLRGWWRGSSRRSADGGGRPAGRRCGVRVPWRPLPPVFAVGAITRAFVGGSVEALLALGGFGSIVIAAARFVFPRLLLGAVGAPPGVTAWGTAGDGAEAITGHLQRPMLLLHVSPMHFRSQVPTHGHLACQAKQDFLRHAAVLQLPVGIAKTKQTRS